MVKIATQAASDLYLTGAICQAANDNGGGQVVISGTKAAVERAMELAKLAGAKRALLLPVSAPFHCALMQPAALAMAAALKSVEIRPPKPPLVANVEASAVDDPEAIRSGLVAQVTGTVRWRESVAYMSAHGVTRFIEIGTGKVLAGLIKRIVGGRDGDQHRHARRRRRLQRLGEALTRLARRTTPLFDLTGRTALVTGASGGLGGAIARALHAQGATVALSGTRREALEALAAELKDRAHAAPCDLADAAAVEALVPAAEAALGSLDILVNNAGVTRDNLFMRMKDADWDSVLAINLTAAFRLSRAALKGMMKRRYGRIINITSIVGVTGNPGQANYAAAKAGMIGMSKALAAEVATRGITVNCIAPGLHRQPDDRRADRQAARGDPRLRADGAAGLRRGHRRRGGLSGERGSSLRDRTDAACERRNGNDLMALSPQNGLAAAGLAALSPWRKRYAIDAVRRRAREGRRLFERRRRRTPIETADRLEKARSWTAEWWASLERGRPGT